MRLKMLEDGRGLRPIQWLISRIVKLMSGNFLAPPIIVASYRREIFGKPFATVVEKSMRGMTYWSKDETELMAAFVARRNACRF